MENKNFSVKCFLPVVYIYCGAGPGCFIILELQVERMLLLVTHIIFILFGFFLLVAVALL